MKGERCRVRNAWSSNNSRHESSGNEYLRSPSISNQYKSVNIVDLENLERVGGSMMMMMIKDVREIFND